MRRLLILFSIALLFGLALVTAALAAPPNCEELPLEHPRYCGPPPSSTTTTTTEAPTLEACQSEFDIEVLKPGRVGHECLWTPEEPDTIPAEGVEGIVTVTPSEGVSSLVVFVRDDAPGDICLLAPEAEDQTGTDGSFVGSFDLSYYCDVPDGYEAWLEESYWTLLYKSDYVPLPAVVGAYWCGPQDPVLESIRFDTNGTPLHLSIGFKAKKDTGPVAVTLSVVPKSSEG